jgi:hypothetical protein
LRYLVAAENRHSSEVLNRVKALDNCLFLGKLVGGSSEVRVDDGGKHFGNKANGNADAEKCSTLPVSCGFTRDDQDLKMVSG